MATIMCLPDEVIAIILGYSDITIEDIINFRCVCKQFRWAAKYDKHWKKKFSQRWPSAKKLYDKQSKENEKKDSEENEQKNKKSLNFIETGINCIKQLRNFVSQIIHEHCYNNKPINNYEHKSIINCDHNPIDNLIEFNDVFHLDNHLRNNLDDIIYDDKNFIKYSFFIDEIKNLLTQPSRRIGCNLTERYCNQKILHNMKYRWMKKNLSRFERQPVRERPLEQFATIVAQGVQPEKDVFYSCIKASLDSIAQEVLNCLRKKHPNHSIFSTSAETFTYWKNNNIDDNYWNEAEGTQIMDTLQKYIFGKLNFRPSNSEGTNLEYMCIDNVLKNKCGHETILLIIYHSVARRLGLRCDVVKLRIVWRCCHHSIFWKPKYATNSLENARCFRIISKKFPDCIVNQLLTFRTQYLSVGSYNTFATTALQMWLQMRELFANVINQHTPFGINTQDYGLLVVKHELRIRIEKTEPLNTRPEDVKFAVGMIVAHGDQPTENCAGVIIGWHRYVDKHITLSLKDMDMIRVLPLNHCRNIRFIKRQTNYIILTENNKMCYVGEDTITLTTPKWIENSEIGRYFCTFEDTHYVPNKMLASLYPQDAAITAAITDIYEN